MDESIEDEEEVIVEPIPENDDEKVDTRDNENKVSETNEETNNASEIPPEEIAPTLSVENMDTKKSSHV